MSEIRTVYVWMPELAQRWGVTERTIRRWITKGSIPEAGIAFHFSRVGHRYGWTESQIADLEDAMISRGVLDPRPEDCIQLTAL